MSGLCSEVEPSTNLLDYLRRGSGSASSFPLDLTFEGLIHAFILESIQIICQVETIGKINTRKLALTGSQEVAMSVCHSYIIV